MKTNLSIDGTKFLINGRLTYADARPGVQGMLFNSRMVQAVFDDDNPETRPNWAYPDTGVWDPDRNTREFVEQLPVYRAHGLLAVTVGLQGGGAVYRPEVYDRYVNSAFAPDGEFKEAYFDRLGLILEAADRLGMVVIVNYFYRKQVEKMPRDGVVCDVAARATERLLATGYRNILLDILNESAPFWKRPLCEPDQVHKLIETVQSVSLDGRRLPASVSTAGGDWLPRGKWLEREDFHLPHGNGCAPERLRKKLLALSESEEQRRWPRPIVVNEDGVSLDNMKAAVEAGCSWGFYCQGYGSDYGSWRDRPRERNFEELSGFQTVPVNWSINTPVKKAFFQAVRDLTGGAG